MFSRAHENDTELRDGSGILSFYVAKDSTKRQFIEGQSNLMRMLQKIPLTEDERAAVEEGIDLFEKLCQKLADVATPDGFTPRGLSVVARRELPVLSAFETAERRQESRDSK